RHDGIVCGGPVRHPRIRWAHAGSREPAGRRLSVAHPVRDDRAWNMSGSRYAAAGVDLSQAEAAKERIGRAVAGTRTALSLGEEIGRASCRERGWRAEA